MVLLEIISAYSGSQVRKLRNESIALFSRLEDRLRKELLNLSGNPKSAKYERIDYAISRIGQLRPGSAPALEIYLAVQEILPVYEEYCTKKKKG